MNKLASIEIIRDISPIPNADRIELAGVLGYQSIVKRGEYKVGDKIIFVFCDTIMPPTHWNQFLWDKKDPAKQIRVKTVRMKGVISQGVIFPLSTLPEMSLEVGQDVDGLLNISHYEVPLPLELAGKAEGGYYPSRFGISPTDEDNAQSNPDLLKEFNGLEISCSLKADGSSGSFLFYKTENVFKVCSRRLTLLEDKEQGRESLNTFWFIANKYNLKEKLSSLGYSCLVRGEVCSNKIQKNRLGLTEPELFVFDVFKLGDDTPIQGHSFNGGIEQFGYKQTKDFCEHNGLRMVKNIMIDGQETFIFDEKIHTLEWLQNISDNQKYDNGNSSEGIVIRPINSTYSRSLGRNLSCKILNRNYNSD